jgi:hypothetical protein
MTCLAFSELLTELESATAHQRLPSLYEVTYPVTKVALATVVISCIRVYQQVKPLALLPVIVPTAHILGDVLR